MSEFLKDRYCTCKTLCVWIPMDGPARVWSVPPRAFQAYCPTCKIIVSKYWEKDEHNALMLTPQVSFSIFKEKENLKDALAAKDDNISVLLANNRELADQRVDLMNAVSAKDARIKELEKALRDIADFDDCDCDGCTSCIARKALEGRDE
jgi:hypothetical protein